MGSCTTAGNIDSGENANHKIYQYDSGHYNSLFAGYPGNVNTTTLCSRVQVNQCIEKV